MASAISQSSVATVTEDLVSDRNIPLKVCMLVLNVAQIVSCWAVFAIFINRIGTDEYIQLEIILTAVFLIGGNYIIAGITNGVIYLIRWKKSSIGNRHRMEEESKQAWVLLRIGLTLLGIPTVGRYIETIIVSRKLNILEKKHVHESVTNYREGSQMQPISGSRHGSASGIGGPTRSKQNISNSMQSGLSQASGNGITESSLRKVRRARRQYKRCEHDGALMALLAGSTGAGPIAIVFGLLYLRRTELATQLNTGQGAVLGVAFILNIVWLAASLTHFYPARHLYSEAEFERGIRGNHFFALVLLFFAHLVQVTLRVIIFSVFTNWFYGYVLIPIGVQWLVGIILFLSYRAYMKSNTRTTFGQRAKSESLSFLSAVYLGYVGIFDFVNGNEGKTRLRYLVYYAFYYAENISMLVAWAVHNPRTQIQFPIPFVAVTLALFWLGFILLQLYLWCFSYSPHGTSVIGFCVKKPEKDVRYAEEVPREPVFGVPISQSAVPLWKQNNYDPNLPAGSKISGMSSHMNNNNFRMKPLPATYEGKSPSIISGKPSIMSPPHSEINVRLDQPKTHRAVKPPPVIVQKAKLDNIRSRAPVNSSSSSDSSSDEGPVYTPKTQSHPDLSIPPLSTSSSSEMSHPSLRNAKSPQTESASLKTPPPKTPTYNSGQYKAEPVNYTPVPMSLGSRSLDNLSSLMPSSQPNKRTKPIGGGADSKGTIGSQRPRQIGQGTRPLQNRRPQHHQQTKNYR